MDLDDKESGFGPGLPPAMVSLTPFASSVSPSPRRLSSCFARPNEPVRAKRQLAWVSLQGRLVGADEASSIKTIDRNGALSAEEAVAWDLFSPIQRVMTVAVVGAAAANSQKNKQILKLQKSVEQRDQVLLSMQKKLDHLCEQVNYVKDHTEVEAQSDVLTAMECCSKLCHHNLPPNGSPFNTSTKGLNGDEVFVSNETEPDERRMSDLSDWAPSVTSSVDIQLDGLALEHDIHWLRKECEDKDVTIKELSNFLESSQVLGSKRIAELEDIIRRKNMIINKLRKDLDILEQKVVNLTRLKRPSVPSATSNLQQQQHPKMADNVLYDMDTTTGPSSPDSDSSPRNRAQALAMEERETRVKISEAASKGDITCHVKTLNFNEKNVGVRTTVPLKENSFNQAVSSVEASRPKHTASAGGGENRSRRRPPIKSKDVAANKRWV